MEKNESSKGSLHADASISSEISGLASIMLGSSPDGIALVDRDTFIVRVINDSALELLNATPESVLGQVIPLAVGDHDAQELTIEHDANTRVFVSVHKQDIEQNGRVYWLLSIRNVTARVEMREQLRSQSIKDDLTGLLNRRGFVALGQHALSLADREKRHLLIVFVDLDGMKEINDKYGHHRGDGALVDAAALLRQTFRKSDVVARMGGDEFAVIAQCRTTEDKAHIQRRLSENLEALNERSSGPYRLSMSVGLVDYDGGNSCGLDQLLELADAAMYQSKRLKRGTSDTTWQIGA